MSIFSMWREARGNVMRKEYLDAMARMRNANQYAQNGFHNEVNAIADHIREAYATASNSDRKAMLKELRKRASQMWDQQDWPGSLGVAMVCLNAESMYVPGDDAAYVRRETDRIIEEAKQAMIVFTGDV